MRAESGQRGRAEWLAVGTAIAAQQGAAAATPEAAVLALGADPAELAAHFPDARAFRVGLMMQGMDDIRGEVIHNIQNRRPGGERLAAALLSWLDANLSRPWVRELVFEMTVEPGIGDQVRKRTNGFILMLQLEFETMGWPRAGSSARLTAAAMIEIAMAEFEQRAEAAELRATLLTYLQKR